MKKLTTIASAALAMILVLAPDSGAAQVPVFAGGGEVAPAGDDHITAAQRTRIDRMLQHNMDRLHVEGRLQTKGLYLPMAGALQWPLRAAPGFESDPGQHGISNFVDHDPGYPDQLLDWNCGRRTYDMANGNDHAGTDIFLWPFYWLKMDQGAVDIVAAAPGQIIGKEDGHFDRSCSFDGAGTWNAVYVQHADGSVAWYGHMRKNSVTDKTVGDTVSTGEYLGKVGSSGMSTGPHLHFELHDSNQTVRDPYHGSCNALPSLWAEQKPYHDSAINKVASHSAPPRLSQNCPNPEAETPNYQNHFRPGDRIYFAFYYRDQLPDQESRFLVYRPDGTPYTQWEHKMSDSTADPYYASSYWYWSVDWPESTDEGTWRVEVSFEGKTYSHNFHVGHDWLFEDGFELDQ